MTQDLTGGAKKPDREWAKAVWKVVGDIPEGHVLTYGEVARLSGNPRYARRVGQAMRWAPRNLELPWHRVINAGGRVSRRAGGSAFESLQRTLLEAEGISFDTSDRIDLERYGWP